MAPEPSPVDALAAAIAGADRRTREAAAGSLRAHASGAADIPLLIDAATTSLHDALVLLRLTERVGLREPPARPGIQAAARALDAAVIVLGDTATQARRDVAARAAGGALEPARGHLLHTLEQREADIAVRAWEIQRYGLAVRRAREQVASSDPETAMPAEPQRLLARLDLEGRMVALQTAVASSRRTVPNLLTLHRDDALPMSLDVHARAIDATAETARVVDALLDLRDAVAARWPDR